MRVCDLAVRNMLFDYNKNPIESIFLSAKNANLAISKGGTNNE